MNFYPHSKNQDVGEVCHQMWFPGRRKSERDFELDKIWKDRTRSDLIRGVARIFP